MLFTRSAIKVRDILSDLVNNLEQFGILCSTVGLIILSDSFSKHLIIPAYTLLILKVINMVLYHNKRHINWIWNFKFAERTWLIWPLSGLFW